MTEKIRVKCEDGRGGRGAKTERWSSADFASSSPPSLFGGLRIIFIAKPSRAPRASVYSKNFGKVSRRQGRRSRASARRGARRGAAVPFEARDASATERELARGSGRWRRGRGWKGEERKSAGRLCGGQSRERAPSRRRKTSRAAKHRERNPRRKAYALARFSSNFVLRPA